MIDEMRGRAEIIGKITWQVIVRSLMVKCDMFHLGLFLLFYFIIHLFLLKRNINSNSRINIDKHPVLLNYSLCYQHDTNQENK